MTISQERLTLAADRFAAFFNELAEHFVERQDVLAQVALALIAREHLLMTGPPGTAKSRLARAVLGRIVDGKTGKPSVFSRQFTESTVQTDLIGPINFKTLMETGRTEHFADEGMLGSVHAFLDEVFDGRDMLLRSTLNVLQERELKQGATTTKGQIECALMTTNRYLAEVLEGSRETLLAFVDRIAFIAYVPKGFATANALAKILEDQIAGNGAIPLRAQLTIQDIDVLQAAAEGVLVDRTACERLAAFLASFESEIASVMRADPAFIPTRYLSTRTAVRLGGILKAAAVFDFAMESRHRSLCVLPKDFKLLRLALLLTGPSYESLTALLNKESNPRERQQLSLMRTEREVFERCLLQVPDWSYDVSQTVVEPELANTTEIAALALQTTEVLIANAKKLSELLSAGDCVIGDAEERLEHTLYELARRGASWGLGIGFAAEHPSAIVDAIAALTAQLTTLSMNGGHTRAWLYGCALRILECEVQFAVSYYVELLAKYEEWRDFAQTVAYCTKSIVRLRELTEKRDQLVSLGAVTSTQMDAAWSRLRSELKTTLVTAWNGHIVSILGEEQHSGKVDDLRKLLIFLEQVIGEVRAEDRQLQHLDFEAHELERGVLEPCLMPLLKIALSRIDVANRNAVSGYVEGTLTELQRMGLGQSFDTTSWLGWIAEALLQSPVLRLEPTRFAANHIGYRELRSSMPRTTLCFVLVDTAMRLCAVSGQLTERPDERIRELVAVVDVTLRRKLVERDVEQIRSVLFFLRNWWEALKTASASSSLIESSEFHSFMAVVHDECALSRYGFEVTLTREVSAEPIAEEALNQIEAFRAQIHEDLSRLLLDHRTRVWSSLAARGQA